MWRQDRRDRKFSTVRPVVSGGCPWPGPIRPTRGPTATVEPGLDGRPQARCLHQRADMPRPRLSAPGWVLLALTIGLLGNLYWRDRRPPLMWFDAADPLGACAVATERPGEGLVCLEPTATGAAAGATVRLPQAGDHPPAGLRAVLAGIPLDLQTATATELATLPEIGSVSAQSLVAARDAGRLRCQADLAAVRGLGQQRLRRLLAFVRPLPQVCPSAHPTQ